MRIVAHLALGVLLLAAPALRAAPAGEPPLKLIPSPQECRVGPGSFRFTAATGVVLGDPQRDADRFAAGQLAAEAARELHVTVALQPAAGPSVLLGLASDQAVAAALAQRGLAVDARLGAEGYVLDVSPAGVVVAANQPAGTFYGVQTLKQLIRANRTGDTIPAVRIRDWPGLRYRGYSDDISRGPIPTMDFFKRQIRTMAEFKMNLLTLYTEHVFKIQGHPKIAPDDGLTPAQVRELDAYARLHHVELVGNFQSFGHFYNILRHDEYKDCRETMGVLSPVKEESYKLLDAIYDSIVPAYSSTLFNVNCDETYGLGEGPSKDLVAQIGVGGVYLRHMKRVHDMLAARGKRMMMWGDIALQHPDIIVAGLPRDTILLSWGYGAAPNYDAAILPFKKVGFEFMVCPGVSCWSQIFPHYENAVVNIHNYVRDGAKNGAIGMMNTTWDDDGENFGSWNFYGLNWGGQCAWRPDASELGDYDAAWSQVSYGTRDDSADRAVKLLASAVSIGLTRSLQDNAFWESPFGSFATSVKSTQAQAAQLLELTRQAITLLQQSQAAATLDAQDFDYLLFAARRLQFLAQSRLDRIAAAQAFEAATESAGPVAPVKAALEQARAKTTAMQATVLALRDEYRRLWDLENRPHSRDGILGRYDRLAAGLGDEAKRLEAALTSLERPGAYPDGRPLGLELTETTARNTKAKAAATPVFTGPVAWAAGQGAYRLPLAIDPGDIERVDCPIELRLNLTGIQGDAHAAQVRLVECQATGAPSGDVPCQFNATGPAAGQLVFILGGRTPAKTPRRFMLYLDLAGQAPGAKTEAGITATDDPRGSWIETAQYKILLGRQGMHLHIWQVKALGGSDVTDPGDTSYHGFADTGFEDRDVAFDWVREANGPVMVRFRGRAKTTGHEKVVTFFAGLPWVEVQLDRAINFCWDYDHPQSFAADMPLPGTALFSNGVTEPVCRSSEQKHNVGHGTFWGAKVRGDGFVLANLTPEVATTHMTGPGGGWGGVGVEGGAPASHFVTYAAQTAGRPAEVLTALQRTLDYRNQVRMVVGPLEQRP